MVAGDTEVDGISEANGLYNGGRATFDICAKSERGMEGSGIEADDVGADIRAYA